ARALACPPEKIVFNGPAKTGPDLETALNEGALVVVDSFDEMATVRALAATAGKSFRIGLRIGLEPRESPWSRFGFTAETGEAVLAMRRAATSGLAIEMLHNHGGTDRTDPAPYARAAESLGRLAQTAAELGHEVTRIDLGGGFATGVAPSAYAEPVLAVLDRVRERTGRAMGLVIEPGRAIVDPAVVLLATVMAVKAGARRAVTLDAGINLLPPAGRARPRTVRVLASKALNQAGLPTDVFGPLCMPQDLVAEGAALPPLNPGDIVAIEETGAYTISQSMQFIAPRPAVVLMSAEGEAPIRRREDWRDVFALDALPDRLWPKGAEF
ncbi:MAG: hypothetical protein WCF16_02770, partial [Alphaproteobacteria bacterium]